LSGFVTVNAANLNTGNGVEYTNQGIDMDINDIDVTDPVAPDSTGNPFMDFDDSTEKYFDDYVDSISFDNLRGCNGIECVILSGINIIQYLILILISASLVVFLWGIVKYVKSTDDNTRKEAVNVIILGIIVLFIMVSVWGLVRMLMSTFEITGSKNLIEKDNIRPADLIQN